MWMFNSVTGMLNEILKWSVLSMVANSRSLIWIIKGVGAPRDTPALIL